MDEETRRTIIKSLLDQRDTLLLERLEVRAEIARLTKRDNDIVKKITDIAAASRVFEYPIGYTLDAADFISFDALTAQMTKLRRGEPWVPGKSMVATKEDYEEFLKRPSYVAPTNRLKPGDLRGVSPVAPPTEAPKIRVRDRVLHYVQEVGSKGAGASEIRKHLKVAHGVETHSKTVGMTLFRLSREGLVRRDKRTWFFVPPSAETKNPGGSAPGSIEARSDGKEGET